LLFYGVISIYIKNKYNILIILKRRILYIILGILLLSKVGVGQTVTSSKISVCDFENFTLTISHTQRIYFFIDNSIDNGVTWTPGNIFYSTSSSSPYKSDQVISINASTKYRIRFNTINSQSGLTTLDPNLFITWNALPNATVATPSTICNGVSINIGSSTVSGSTYSWSSNVGTFSSTNSNPSVSPSSTQTYTLTETITATGCYNSNNIAITVNALPVINSLMDTTKVCGTKTILDAGAGYSSYLWSNGSTARYISTDVSQNYFVTVTNSSSCSSIDSTFLSIVDAKLFNSDTTILAGASVNINTHGILNSADRAVLYDFTNANALNDFVTLTTSSGTVSITTSGETGKGVELVRASNCCSDAEMKTTRENFGYGTYEVDAYSASGIADQSFGIMEQSGSWVNRVLNIGTRPKDTDNQGWDVIFKGINIASSNTSPVSNGTWYKIKVYITPTTLKVWLNTTVIFDGPLPSAITNPRGAIRVGAYDVSRYDNIKYTPLQELSYLWSTSSTNQNITVTPTVTSTYQLKVTDQTTTCNTSVDIRVLKINITNADASICNNTTQTLYIDSSFSKYASWQTKKPGIEFYNIKKDLNGNLYALPSLNNQKIYKSIDRGETWNQMAGFPSLGSTNFMALGVDQNNVIYASTNNNGMYKSIDEGVTWTQLQDFGFGCGPMDILFGNNFSILTVKGSSRGIWSSTGDLFSWQQKVAGFDPNTVTQDINGNLYAGGNSAGGKELYKSSNLGATWSKISSLYGVQIIRADSNGKVFLTEGGNNPLFASSNQGTSFSQINTLSLPNSGISYPEDILFTKNIMFITKGQVYYSKNDGAIFTKLDKITFPTAGTFNYGPGGAPSGNYGDSTNRMEMIGNRLFVASLDGIKFIDIDNLNTTVTWSTGEVGNKIEVNPISTSPGNTVTYSATVSYGAVTGSDQVTFTLPTKPTITASGATTFCQGGTVTLTANSSPAGVYSYTWQTGAITQGITVASAGSYSVTAVNSIGCSETSTPTIITVNDLPAAPTANSVSLNYNGLQQTTPDLIPPSGQSISWFTLPVGGVNSSKPQGINVGTYNSYANAIIDATGCISSSRTLVFLTITKKSITITVDPNQTKVYGAANPLTYTYGVSPSLTGLAALNGTLTRVSGEAVGPYAIEQNDLTTANNPNYTINYVGNNFTITKKSITITATAGQSKVYGAANPSTYVYTVSPSITGLASLTGTLTRVSGETVGPYAIEQNDLTTANNPNYTISYVGNNFTITKKSLTITVDPNQTKVYGAANPLTYTYGVSPSLAGLAALNGTLTRVSGETVGPYAIEQNDLTTANNPNYTISYVGNNFTITKKSLIITADNKTKFYGAANPIFTYTYSGLVNGDLATFTWPTIITTADQNSPAGTYPIIPSAATDPNYTITYVNGILTVTKTALTITAKPHTILYNGTNYSGGNGVILTGMATGESISNLTGTLNYKGTSQGAINVGTYTIIPDGLSSPNYNINYVGDALEIKKATLKIVAGNQIVNFGTPTSKILTDATFTYVSLLGGDNASVITGSLSYSTNYTPLTSPGITGIYIEPIITGLSAANYELIAEKGNITITALLTSPAFQMPNAFTPNSDGHNDTFKIIQNGYVTSIISFRIFTKSGKLIFNDKDGAWDGRYAGVMLDSDIYIWIADFMNKNNVQEHLTGTVLLLK
jgi:gliding motility-associated-like protein